MPLLPPVRTRRFRPARAAFVLAIALAAGSTPSAAQDAPALEPFPAGRSTQVVELDGVPLNLWAYKPGNYVGDGFIVLFHGASRAAEAYRDNAAGFAETYGRLVVVPEFDAEGRAVPPEEGAARAREIREGLARGMRMAEGGR